MGVVGGYVVPKFGEGVGLELEKRLLVVGQDLGRKRL